MTKYGVPTAQGETFTSLKAAEAYVKKMGAPIVVKADGLAAGKGVIVCSTQAQALAALKQILVDREFGEAGDKVVVEECLVGVITSYSIHYTKLYDAALADAGPEICFVR